MRALMTILETSSTFIGLLYQEENHRNFGLDFITMEDQYDVLKTGDAVFHN